MRTRLSICRKKARYPSYEDALAAARGADIALRPYHCDRCWQFHLTGRLKGKWMPRDKNGTKREPTRHPELVSGSIVHEAQRLQ